MSNDHDELASAYLDGEVTDEEAARVESDPQLLDRVDVLLQVRLSSLPEPTPDPEIKRRHLTAALDEFATLAPVRALPVQSKPRRAQWLAAAAAGIVVLGGIGLGLRVATTGSGTDEDTAGAASSESLESSDRSAAMTSAADAENESGDNDASEDAVADSSGGADGTEEDAAGVESATAPAPAPLLMNPLPSASEALVQAEAEGLVVAGSETIDRFGCTDLLGLVGTLVAVVTIESADDEAHLYVLGSGPPYAAHLLTAECVILSSTP